MEGLGCLLGFTMLFWILIIISLCCFLCMENLMLMNAKLFLFIFSFGLVIADVIEYGIHQS